MCLWAEGMALSISFARFPRLEYTKSDYLVLLPVWVVLLQSEDGHSLALVNGQTGKTVMGLTLPNEEVGSHE